MVDNRPDFQSQNRHYPEKNNSKGRGNAPVALNCRFWEKRWEHPAKKKKAGAERKERIHGCKHKKENRSLERDGSLIWKRGRRKIPK